MLMVAFLASDEIGDPVRHLRRYGHSSYHFHLGGDFDKRSRLSILSGKLPQCSVVEGARMTDRRLFHLGRLNESRLLRFNDAIEIRVTAIVP